MTEDDLRRQAVYQRSQELLRSSGDLLDEVATREPVDLWQPPAEAPREQPQPPRPARQDPAVQVSREWVRDQISKSTDRIAEILGGEVGLMEKEHRKEHQQEAELAAAKLEARLAEFKADLLREILQLVAGPAPRSLESWHTAPMGMLSRPAGSGN